MIMRPAFFSLAGGMALAASLAAASLPALAADPQISEREEIVVTHKRLAPLSEWAQMQAHEAEYQRLKAKFDPSPAESPVDLQAADRESVKPPQDRIPPELQAIEQNGEAPVVKALTQGSP
jgi:hypothetical protein